MFYKDWWLVSTDIDMTINHNNTTLMQSHASIISRKVVNTNLIQSHRDSTMFLIYMQFTKITEHRLIHVLFYSRQIRT